MAGPHYRHRAGHYSGRGASGPEPANARGCERDRRRVIRAGFGIQVLGGEGPMASANAVRVRCPAGNRFTDVPTPWDVRDDIDGAGGNDAQVTWCAYLPAVEVRQVQGEY